MADIYTSGDIVRDVTKAEASRQACAKSSANLADVLHKLAKDHPGAFAQVIGAREHIKVSIGSNGQISGWKRPGETMGRADDDLYFFIEQSIVRPRRNDCIGHSR